MTKFFSFLISVLLCTHAGKSQVIKSIFPPSQFSESINVVVCDFKNNFYHIQGEPMIPQEEMDVYKSNISLPGSINTVIYRFHSKIDTTASWQTIIFQGENYANALKAYKNTSRLLNKCRISLPGNGPVGFTGKLNEPEPNVTFAGSSFKLNTDDVAYAKFFADIEIVNTGFDSWEVRLNLHNKKEDFEKY